MDEPNDVKEVRDQFEKVLVKTLSDVTGPVIEDFEPLTVDVDVTVTSRSDEPQSKHSNGWAPVGDGTSKEPRDEPRYKCVECGTICKHAPGIGRYCPDLDCEIVDGPGFVELEDGEDR